MGPISTLNISDQSMWTDNIMFYMLFYWPVSAQTGCPDTTWPLTFGFLFSHLLPVPYSRSQIMFHSGLAAVKPNSIQKFGQLNDLDWQKSWAGGVCCIKTNFPISDLTQTDIKRHQQADLVSAWLDRDWRFSRQETLSSCSWAFDQNTWSSLADA